MHVKATKQTNEIFMMNKRRQQYQFQKQFFKSETNRIKNFSLVLICSSFIGQTVVSLEKMKQSRRHVELYRLRTANLPLAIGNLQLTASLFSIATNTFIGVFKKLKCSTVA